MRAMMRLGSVAASKMNARMRPAIVACIQGCNSRIGDSSFRSIACFTTLEINAWLPRHDRSNMASSGASSCLNNGVRPLSRRTASRARKSLFRTISSSLAVLQLPASGESDRGVKPNSGSPQICGTGA